MRTKHLTESELFKKINILLLEENKVQLEDIKEKLSLLANVEIDNSGLTRGIIQYLYDNPDEIKKIVNHVVDAKGYNVLMRFNELIEKGKSNEDIDKELGLGLDIIESVRKKYNI